MNGKVVPALTFKGAQLTHESHPTFLGLTLDSQLTFTKHIDEVKKRMSQRRRCLAALAGRSYGSNRPTLRTTYIAYIRSVADYGAAFYSTHAAPSVRARLEAEQHKCARVLTGCIRLTNSCTEARRRREPPPPPPPPQRGHSAAVQTVLPTGQPVDGRAGRPGGPPAGVAGTGPGPARQTQSPPASLSLSRAPPEETTLLP